MKITSILLEQTKASFASTIPENRALGFIQESRASVRRGDRQLTACIAPPPTFYLEPMSLD